MRRPRPAPRALGRRAKYAVPRSLLERCHRVHHGEPHENTPYAAVHSAPPQEGARQANLKRAPAPCPDPNTPEAVHERGPPHLSRAHRRRHRRPRLAQRATHDASLRRPSSDFHRDRKAPRRSRVAPAGVDPAAVHRRREPRDRKSVVEGKRARCYRDWSSDVCSSDLPFMSVDRRTFLERTAAATAALAWPSAPPTTRRSDDLAPIFTEIEKRHDEAVSRLQEWIRQPSIAAENREIGRASWRERERDATVTGVQTCALPICRS